MSRFGIEGLVRRWSASLIPSSLYKRAWMVHAPKARGGHPCPTNQPMSAESGRSLGERAAACGRLEARGRSWEYEAVLGGHGSPKVRVKAVEHWVRAVGSVATGRQCPTRTAKTRAHIGDGGPGSESGLGYGWRM